MKRKKNTRAIPPTACCEASLSAWAAGPFRTPARVVGSRKSAKKNAPGRFTIKRKNQGARGVCSIFCVFLRFLAARGVCSRWGRLLRSSRYFYSVLHGIFSQSAFAPENLVSRDGFGSPVPLQPAHLHTQANLVLTYGIPPEFRGGVHLFI